MSSAPGIAIDQRTSADPLTGKLIRSTPGLTSPGVYVWSGSWLMSPLTGASGDEAVGRRCVRAGVPEVDVEARRNRTCRVPSTDAGASNSAPLTAIGL